MKVVNGIIILTFITLIILASGSPVIAVRPIHTGVAYPSSPIGVGTVTGRVVHTVNGTVGMSGVYVAIVNAMDPTQEYANTTSDLNGNFSFTGVNATYNSVTGEGDRGAFPYRIYANNSSVGEGYSAAFGVDVNNTIITAVVILTADSMPTLTPTPLPSTSLTPTPSPTPSPTITPTSGTSNPSASPTNVSTTPMPSTNMTPSTTIPNTPTPTSSTPQPSPAIPALMAILVIGIVAYYKKK